MKSDLNDSLPPSQVSVVHVLCISGCAVICVRTPCTRMCTWNDFSFLLAANADQIQSNFVQQTLSEDELKVHA